jgi:hypothetical protein
MTDEINRRAFVKGSVLASAGAALGLASAAPALAGDSAGSSPATGNPPVPQTGLPKGKIGKMEVSRILLGGNLLTHFTHSRDLKYVYNLAAHYNTQKKIIETLAIAEQNGINTMSVHTAATGIVKLLKKYREKEGGKIQWIICPTNSIEPGLAKYEEQVQQLVDDGVDAIYIWGVHSDALVAQGKIDLLGKAVDLVKTHGVPCGVGAHMLGVVQACEKNKIANDFYIKTFHHHKYDSAAAVTMVAGRGPGLKEADLGSKTISGNHDAMWCFTPEETIEYMRGVEKPWIAFKVMAAGAIPPRDAFRYVFENGADFSLAGMFDFEIAEDVRIAREVLAGLPKRSRPWRG